LPLFRWIDPPTDYACPFTLLDDTTTIIRHKIMISLAIASRRLRRFVLVVSFLSLFVDVIRAAEDFYRLLGIRRDASQKEIKKAYRAKSLEYHPDKNKNEGASEKFAEIAYAYEVLTDEDKKAVYDRHGEDGLKQHEQRQGQGGHGHGGFEDIFSHFGFNFGGGGRGRQREQTTPNVDVPLRVTLRQLYLGDTIEVQYVRQTLCVNWQECMRANQECQGPGVKVRMQQIAPGFVQQVQQRDDRCVAHGKMWSPNCRACQSGQTQSETIDLTIDLARGMSNGEPITFEGVSDEKPGMNPGDLNFIIVQVPSEGDVYHRDGDHLYATVEIPLVDALVSFCCTQGGRQSVDVAVFLFVCITLSLLPSMIAHDFVYICSDDIHPVLQPLLQTGFTHEFEHLDGHKFKVEVSGVTECDHVMRVTGKGMPRRGNRGFGDLFITFEVDFPNSLTDEQRKGIRELLGGKSGSDEL
jgi:DnaJ-class molecular chaperone